MTVDGVFAVMAVCTIVALGFARPYVLLLGRGPQSFARPVPAGERSGHLPHRDMACCSPVTERAIE